MKKVFTLIIALCIAFSSFGQWNVLTSATHLTVLDDMEWISANEGFIVGTTAMPGGNAIISKTTNGGASWQKQFELASFDGLETLVLNDIEIASPNVIYAVGGPYKSRGVICKSMNGGMTWDTIAHNTTCAKFLNAHFFDANNGFFVGDEVYKTTDGGATLTLVPSPVDYFGLGDIKFLNANVGYAIGNWDDLIIKTNDGGATWNELTSPTTDAIKSMYFIDENTGFLAYDQGDIYKTIDGGQTWNLATNPVESTVHGFEFINNTTGFAGTLNGVILKTTDGGNTWSQNFDITSSPYIMFGAIYTIKFPTSTIGYVGGLTSFVVKTTNGGGSSSAIGEVEFATVDMYPNPVNDLLNIKVQDQNIAYTISVKSVDGKEVLSLQVQGDTQLDMDAIARKGIYIVELAGDDIAVTKRIIKL